MLILRIRQAEVALHDGRLDEAFELMQPTAVRSHRRGQDVLGKLVRALVQRLDSAEYDSSLQLKVLPLVYADSQSVARAINDAKEIAVLDLYEGMPHVFQIRPEMTDSPETKAAMKKMTRFLKEHLGE